MDDFDLKKYLVENKLTKQSIQNEGFRDMFQKSKPSETFQGSSKEEFIKWATSVFKEKGIPEDDYDYFLGDVDSSYNWDESYKGVSQDELVNYHLKPWLLRNNFSADEYSLNEIMMYSPQSGGVDQDWDDAARRAAEKEKKRKADLGDEEYARVKGEETLSYSIIQAKRAAKALDKDISKEIEDIKTKYSDNTTKQKEAVKRLYSKLNKERINK